MLAMEEQDEEDEEGRLAILVRFAYQKRYRKYADMSTTYIDSLADLLQ